MLEKAIRAKKNAIRARVYLEGHWRKTTKCTKINQKKFQKNLAKHQQLEQSQ